MNGSPAPGPSSSPGFADAASMISLRNGMNKQKARGLIKKAHQKALKLTGGVDPSTYVSGGVAPVPSVSIGGGGATP